MILFCLETWIMRSVTIKSYASVGKLLYTVNLQRSKQYRRVDSPAGIQHRQQPAIYFAIYTPKILPANRWLRGYTRPSVIMGVDIKNHRTNCIVERVDTSMSLYIFDNYAILFSYPPVRRTQTSSRYPTPF